VKPHWDTMSMSQDCMHAFLTFILSEEEEVQEGPSSITTHLGLAAPPIWVWQHHPLGLTAALIPHPETKQSQVLLWRLRVNIADNLYDVYFVFVWRRCANERLVTPPKLPRCLKKREGKKDADGSRQESSHFFIPMSVWRSTPGREGRAVGRLLVSLLQVRVCL